MLRRTKAAVRRGYDLARSPAARERRRREMFWAEAKTHVTAVEVERAGARYLLSPKDIGIGTGFFLSGSFEEANLENVHSELARRAFVPDQLLDVGANMGFVTIDFLRRFRGCSAVAFEPDETNYRLLRQNLIGNDLESRTETHRMALSDADAVLTLELSEENLGDHRVRDSMAAGSFQEQDRATVQVPARRLETLASEGTVTPTDRTVVWMDIQGHECRALAGFGPFTACPTVLEVWPYGIRRAGGELDDFVELVGGWSEIMEVGKVPQTLTRSGLVRRIAELDDVGALHGYTDLLLVP